MVPPRWQASFAEIRADRTTGAGGLAARAAEAVASWAAELPGAGERDLDDLLLALVDLHPALAPMVTLADAAAAAWEEGGAGAVAGAARAFAEEARRAPAAIAAHAVREIDHGARVVAYSASAAVRETLLAARAGRKRPLAILSEARPGLEGRAMAEALARGEVDTRLVLDAALPGYLDTASLVLLGADAVTPDGILNKVGTAALCELAAARQVPVVVLAGRQKHLPARLARHLAATIADPAEVYAGDLPYLAAENPYFDRTPWAHLAHVVAESGPLDPRTVVETLRAAEPSPRLVRLLEERR